ncbi:FHA domain-containing protein [Salinicola avicenniae]|uniref:FHA domain-containing protein n=1 Tax=Salinicola avicenniae TaxID=2916836 RepID=UPI0020730239|nr:MULTISPECIES: FHA domain-containing protein [unclassified Salinicola]
MYELRVMSGLHRGATLPLIGDQWMVGAAEEADLVLFDPGIAPRHLRIRLGDQWQLECLEGALRDGDGHAHARLDAPALNTPFAIAGIWLCITSADVAWPSDAAMDEAERRLQASADRQRAASAAPAPARPRRRGRPSWGKRLTTAAVIVTVATTTWGFVNQLPGEPPDTVSVTPSSPAEPALSVADARRRLTRMLEARELDRYVDVAPSAERIVLTGEIPQGQRAVVERMLDRFRQRYHSALAVENRVETYDNTLPFEIRQIVGGKYAQVVLADGRRLYPGDQVQGLTLTSISADNVSFRGENRRYEVKW